MSDFVTRFKTREVVSPEITFEFGPFLFRVARFSEAERRVALKAARASLKDERIDEPTEVESGVAFWQALTPVIIRHVKGWTHNDASPLPFNSVNLKLITDEFDETEVVRFAVAFLTACAVDAKQKKSSLPGSGPTSSSNGSSTKSKGRKQHADSA